VPLLRTELSAPALQARDFRLTVSSGADAGPCLTYLRPAPTAVRKSGREGNGGDGPLLDADAYAGRTYAAPQRGVREQLVYSRSAAARWRTARTWEMLELTGMPVTDCCVDTGGVAQA
jgi:hypothetical protein